MEEGKKHPEQKTSGRLTAGFTRGAVALVFIIIVYQLALFVHRAALTHLAAHRDRPDTVYVMDRALAEEILRGAQDEPAVQEILRSAQDDKGKAQDGGSASPVILRSGSDEESLILRKESPHSPEVKRIRETYAPRRVENFRFNPNTVSLEDLQRLGFSEKQAQAIENYRLKGGHFNRPEDFARSYVVADSVYRRLAPFIDIPRLDINKADSSQLLVLPGIGPYFAGKVVAYRQRLGGYSCPEQLMEINHFDQEKYDGLKDLVTCSPAAPYPLWELPEEELARHPHISREEAHGIVLFRTHHTAAECTVEGLIAAGILSAEHAKGLSRCRMAPAAEKTQ